MLEDPICDEDECLNYGAPHPKGMSDHRDKVGNVWNTNASRPAKADKPAWINKTDAGKAPLHHVLTLSHSLEAIARVMEFGAKKYSEGNWKNCPPDEIKRYLSATFRHLVEDGLDSQSNLPHLWHALTDLAFYVYLVEQQKEKP